MNMKRQFKNNVYWVGKIDWELEWFHGADFSINLGSSQNCAATGTLSKRILRKPR